LSPVINALTTISCEEELSKATRDDLKLAVDGTYSSRHWHSNEITVALMNAFNNKIVGRQHLLKDTGLLYLKKVIK